MIVDYAHTDDALRNLLEMARPLAARRLITVFGAGGDRDRTKRPLMGMVAARLSDVVVITSDNPRSEDPARIIDEVNRRRAAGDAAARRRGASPSSIGARRFCTRSPRRKPGDVVLIAGKGHEKYQEDRRRDAAVRRRGGGARGAGGAAPQVAGWVTGASPAPWGGSPRRSAGTIRSGDRDGEIGNVVTDTRTLQPGDFFIALRGERFDANEFVGEAFDKGAIGAIVEREPDPLEEPGPQAGRRRSDPPGAGRGRRHDEGAAGPGARGAEGERDDGSSRLREARGRRPRRKRSRSSSPGRFRVVKNKGNLNNHIGLPLSLLQLRERPDVAVMELGMNHAGEISTLVAIAEPEVRVWTNVGDAHLGFFASPDAIADAKAEILERADRDPRARLQRRRPARDGARRRVSRAGR